MSDGHYALGVVFWACMGGKAAPRFRMTTPDLALVLDGPLKHWLVPMVPDACVAVHVTESELYVALSYLEATDELGCTFDAFNTARVCTALPDTDNPVTVFDVDDSQLVVPPELRREPADVG